MSLTIHTETRDQLAAQLAELPSTPLYAAARAALYALPASAVAGANITIDANDDDGHGGAYITIQARAQRAS